MEQKKQEMKEVQSQFLSIIKELQAQIKEKSKAESQFNIAKNRFSGKIPQLQNKIRAIRAQIQRKQKQIQNDNMRESQCYDQQKQMQNKLDYLKQYDQTGLQSRYNQCVQFSKQIVIKRNQLNAEISEANKQIATCKQQIRLLSNNINLFNQKSQQEQSKIERTLQQYNRQKGNLQYYQRQKLLCLQEKYSKVRQQLTPPTDSQRIQIIENNIILIKQNITFIGLIKNISKITQQIGEFVKTSNLQKNDLVYKHKQFTQTIQSTNQQLKRHKEYNQLLLTLKQWNQIEDNSLYLSVGQKIQKQICITLRFQQRLPTHKKTVPHNILQKLTEQQKDFLYVQYKSKIVNTNSKQTQQFLARCKNNYFLKKVTKQLITNQNSSLINYKNFRQNLQKIKKDIHNLIRSSHSDYFIESIANFIQLCNLANFLATKHTLKISQIAAFCQLIHTFSSTNKFCQIKTGEGKTVIVSLLAVFESLKGYPVDIITSNQVLAQDGLQYRKQFYSNFGLTASHNNRKKQHQQNGLKQCYGMNVVYGTISNFQFDWLDHHCNLANTFGQRHSEGHQIVIIDEVDNLVLDKAGDCAKMSDQILGLEDLRFLFIKIWINLCEYEQDYQKIIPKRKTKQEFIKDNLMALKVSFFQRQYPFQSIFDFYYFYRGQNYQKWIDCAIDARYNIHENEDYIIQTAEFGQPVIIPLDRQIGCTLDKTIWTHLHPFVQIKHKLQITSEGFVTMFISNWGYIMEYKRMYGVTGTLGSQEEQKIIKDLYKAETSKIPPLIESKIINHGKYFYVRGTHYPKIIQKALKQCQRRPVLIINETVKDLWVIKAHIQNQAYQNKKVIQIYVYQDQRDQQQIEKLNKEGMKKNQILLATNIGGRGTDLKIDPLALQEGGLFQITTYLPQNIRIQLQAAGRAARNGETGESILIACLEDELLTNLKLTNVPFQISQSIEPQLYKKIQTMRDQKQAARLKQVREKIKSIQQQKQYFQRFLSYLKILVYFKINRYILMDIKTQWGLLFDQWSSKSQDLITNYFCLKQNIFQCFFQFLEQLCCKLPSMLKQYKFTNPYFALKYVQSLLSEDQRGVQAEMTENQKIQYSVKLLENNNGYIKYPFGRQTYNGVIVEKISLLLKKNNENKIQTMVLNTLKQFISKSSSSNQYSNNALIKITDEQINLTLEALNKKIFFLKQIVLNETLRKDSWNQQEQNYLIKHLQCQIFVLTLQKQNIGQLFENFRKFPQNKSYISRKEKYVQMAITEHYRYKKQQSNKLKNISGVLTTLMSGLDELNLSKDIYIEQLLTLEACGGGIFIEINQFYQISINDPRVIRGVKFVGLGLISNLAGLLLPGLGQFIAAAAAGTFIKKGMDCIISAIFDEEPNDQDIIDIISDIALIALTGGIGSLATIVTSCLKSFAKRFLQQKIINQLQKRLEKGIINQLKGQITVLVTPICQKICEARTHVYLMIKQQVIKPVNTFMEEKINDFQKWFYQNAFKEGKFPYNIPSKIVDQIVTNFKEVELTISDLMNLVNQKTSFIKKSFFFIKSLPTVISSLIQKLNFKKIDFSKMNASNIIIIIQIIQQFTKGDLINEIRNLVNNFQQIYMFLNNFQAIINSIQQKMDLFLFQIDKFINKITQFQFDQNFILLICQKIKAIIIIKISQKIIFFLQNNPFQKLLRSQGFCLDNPQTLAVNITSLLWGFIIGTIKTLIFKKVKIIRQRENNSIQNSCGFDAVASLLRITDIHTIEKATGIIQGPRGITLDEMKILLNKIGLKNVFFLKVDGTYVLRIKDYFQNQLNLNQAIGAIAAVRSNDKKSIGHMYAVSKCYRFCKVEFIDRVKGTEKTYNQDIWIQKTGALLIPYGFCQLKRKQICQSLKTMKNEYSFTTGELKQYLLSDLFGSPELIERSPFYPSHQDCKIHITNKLFYKKLLFAFKKQLEKHTFKTDTKGGKSEFMIGAVCLTYQQNQVSKKQYFVAYSGPELLLNQKIIVKNKNDINTRSVNDRYKENFKIHQNLHKYEPSLKGLQIQLVPPKIAFNKYTYNVFGQKINLTDQKLAYMAHYDANYKQIKCKTCAAQKALNRVGQFMHNLKQRNNANELIGLQMYQTWYVQPGASNTSDFSVSQPAKSCIQCQGILPIITMKKNTYLQFEKRKTNGKVWDNPIAS